MLLEEEPYLSHYGILRRSGRYPWGSGKNPQQRSKTFLQIIDDHKKDGLSESEIAKLYHTKEHPFTSRHIRALRSEKACKLSTALLLAVRHVRNPTVVLTVLVSRVIWCMRLQQV